MVGTIGPVLPATNPTEVSRVVPFELLRSPMNKVFGAFVDSLETSGVICSPYLTSGPIDRLLESVERRGLRESLHLQILTDIPARNMLESATDVNALIQTLAMVKQAEVVYVPSLHAKVYVANDETALIGSFNCAEGGLFANLEYGVRVLDRDVVRRVKRDVEDCARLGGVVSLEGPDRIRKRVEALREVVGRSRGPVDPELAALAAEIRREADDELIRLRIAGRSVNGVFTDTIVYLLNRGSMTTEELHPRIRELLPDLCDDTLDRVIDGQHFGKLWKHQVRSAQQHLKRQGRITRDQATGRWMLTGQE